MRARKTIVIPNARDDPRFNLKIDDMMGYRTTSLMAIPVIDSKKTSGTMGALFIANKHGASAFTRIDKAIAQIMSRQVAKLYAKFLSEDEETHEKEV